MTMLEGHFDDSGSEGLGPAFIMAGYVAPVDVWEQFSLDWQSALAEAPRIAHLKMRNAYSLRGEFWGWSGEERDRKLNRLADVILEHISWGVTSALFWEDFRNISAEAPDVPLIPYDILYHGTMAVTAHLVMDHFPKGDKVDFVFDEQQGLGLRTAAGFEYIRDLLEADERRVIAGTPVQRDDKIVLPLQAADMIAWQTRRFIYDQGTNIAGTEPHEVYEINSPVLRRLEQIKTVYNTYNVGRLRYWVEDFRMINSLFPDKELFKLAYMQTMRDRSSPFAILRRPFRPWERNRHSSP